MSEASDMVDGLIRGIDRAIGPPPEKIRLWKQQANDPPQEQVAQVPLADAGRSAYLALRHYMPEAVRMIRLALDCGTTPAELKRVMKGELSPMAKDAIDHMAANPGTGVVVWQGMEYTWADLKEGS
jgi:hypothetical protein